MWPDGARYVGEWRENRAHGQGKFSHIDGDTYEGQWANDKANGKGKYVHTNGEARRGRIRVGRWLEVRGNLGEQHDLRGGTFLPTIAVGRLQLD